MASWWAPVCLEDYDYSHSERASRRRHTTTFQSGRWSPMPSGRLGFTPEVGSVASVSIFSDRRIILVR